VTITISQELTCSGTKNNDINVTKDPTRILLPSPPTTNPQMIICVGTGATNSSSIFFWNFCEKKEDDTFAYELVMADIIIKPGTINSIYEKPPISPIRPPIIFPKMIKYNEVVMTGGTSVWTQIRRYLFVSFMAKLFNAV